MIVVKVGGGSALDLDAIAGDMADLVGRGERVVLIKGANGLRDELAEKLDVRVEKVRGPSGVESVYSPRPYIDLFLMAYCGLSNKRFVELLQKKGVNAVGLSGVDGGLFRARRKSQLLSAADGRVKVLPGNFSGRVESVNSDILRLLLDGGYVPVLTAPALSWEGDIVNCDNDWAAVQVALGLRADRVVFLLDKAGFLGDPADEKTLLRNVRQDELEGLMPLAAGRMKQKLLAVKKALECGVGEVVLADGRIAEPLKKALQGEGTVFRGDDNGIAKERTASSVLC